MIYQFIPVAPVRVMERLIRSMGPGTMAVLDLEDGYFDVRDPGEAMKRAECDVSTYCNKSICRAVGSGWQRVGG